MTLDFESEIVDGDFFMELRDDVQLNDGSTTPHALGKVDEIGNTQENRIQVNVSDLDRDRDDIVRAGAHEVGHTGGLTHPEKRPTQPGKDKNGNELSNDNLMIQGGNGSKVTPEQRKNINDEIKKDTGIQ